MSRDGEVEKQQQINTSQLDSSQIGLELTYRRFLQKVNRTLWTRLSRLVSMQTFLIPMTI